MAVIEDAPSGGCLMRVVFPAQVGDDDL